MEWLASFIQHGREVFNVEINCYNLFADIINLIVPGDIIQTNAIPIGQYLTWVLKGWMTAEHGELLGIYGALYIYFGYLGGVTFFACWFWFSILVVKNCNSIYILFYLWAFVIQFMTGGMIASSFQQFMDNVFCYLSVLFIYKGLKHCRYITNRVYVRTLITE